MHNYILYIYYLNIIHDAYMNIYKYIRKIKKKYIYNIIKYILHIYLLYI